MEIRDKFFLDANNAALIVIDVQEKLCKAMDPALLARLTANIGVLQEAARELALPMLATEQYVRGLGQTLPALRDRLTGPVLEKMTFSSCGCDDFSAALRATGRQQLIITGTEAHVCVLQTVLDLLDQGYHVHLVSDAVMSRKKENWKVGLNVAAAAGAVITSTETALFQLMKVAGTEQFRKLSKLIR
jgi:isochorismate hydrolase